MLWSCRLRLINIAACVVCVCVTHGVHAALPEHAFHTKHAVPQHAGLDSAAAALPLVRGSRPVQEARERAQQYLPLSLQADGGNEEMVPVKPFLIDNAVIVGPSSREIQAQYGRAGAADGSGAMPAAPGVRKLLHGPSRLRDYPRCRTCLAVRCSRSTQTCSGHCSRVVRQRRGSRIRLFDCTSNSRSAATCISQSLRDLAETPPSALPTDSSVVLTARAPVVACALIEGMPTGCPPPGTPATYPGRMQDATITVTNSSCRPEPFVPNCNGPFFPFGICDCEASFEIPGRDAFVLRLPCGTDLVPDWPGEEGVTVEGRGNLTFTQFGEAPAPGDVPAYTYNVVTGTVRGAAQVRQAIFERETYAGDYVVETDISDHVSYDPFDPEDYFVDPEDLVLVPRNSDYDAVDDPAAAA